MTILFNPGSHIGETQEGWTNTYETARAEAERWLAQMHAEGMTDVQLLPDGSGPDEGRWTFTFVHQVTGVEVELETHGISDVDAYCKKHIFTPRVYWDGGSSSTPQLEDFVAPGFEPVRTYRTAAK